MRLCYVGTLACIALSQWEGDIATRNLNALTDLLKQKIQSAYYPDDYSSKVWYQL
jgi:hypothetical protein